LVAAAVYFFIVLQFGRAINTKGHITINKNDDLINFIRPGYKLYSELLQR